MLKVSTAVRVDKPPEHSITSIFNQGLTRLQALLFPSRLLLGLRAAGAGLGWAQKRNTHLAKVHFHRYSHTNGTSAPSHYAERVRPEATNGVALASAGGWQQPLTPSPFQ